MSATQASLLGVVEVRSPAALLPSRFIGRKAELAAAYEQIEAAREGKGRVLVVSGEAGIGKTRFLNEIANRAVQRGFLPLWGRGTDDEGAPAYWPWVQVLRRIVAEREVERSHRSRTLLGEVARLVPDLHHILGFPANLPEVPKHSPSDRFRIFDSVLRLFQEVASREPLVFFLDDMQGGDEPSWHLLDFLSRGIGDSAMLFVCAHRDSEIERGSSRERILANLSVGPTTARIPLRGLSGIETEELVAERLHGHAWLPSFIEELRRKTGGNPFLVVELLRQIPVEAVGAKKVGWECLDFPPSVRVLIANRLAGLTSGAREVLRVASAIGRDFSTDLLSAVVSASDHLVKTTAQLEESVAAGLIEPGPDVVGSYRFRHDLIREAIYSDLASQIREKLHERIGFALERKYEGDIEGIVPTLAAHFLRCSSDAHCRRKAIAYGRRAAAQAMRRLAFEEAIPHLRNSLQLLGGGAAETDERCLVLLDFGEAQSLSGRWSDARNSFTAAARLAETNSWADRYGRAAIGFKGTRGSSVPPDMAAIGMLRKAVDRLPVSPTRVRALAALSEALYSTSKEERLSVSARAQAEAERLDDPESITYGILARLHALASPGAMREIEEKARDLIERASACGDRQAELRAHMYRHTALVRLNPALAAQEIAVCKRLASELQNPTYLWQVATIEAAREIAAGRFADGEARALEAFELGSRVHDATAKQYLAMHWFWSVRLKGQFVGVADAMAPFIEDMPDWTMPRAGLSLAFAMNGEISAARDLIVIWAADEFQGIPDDVFTLVTYGYLAEAIFLLEMPENAELLYSRLLEYEDLYVAASWGAAQDGPVVHYLGLLAATFGDLSAAAHHLRQAIRMIEPMGAYALLARSKLALAEVLYRAGAREEAAAFEQQAAVEHNALGMEARLQRFGPKLENARQRRAGTSTEIRPGRTRNSARIQASSSYRLFRETDYWTLCFNGDVARVRDTKAIRQLAYLLLNPHRNVPALLLSRISVEDSDLRAVVATDFPNPGGMVPVLDAEAVRSYRRRLEDLRAEIDLAEQENDPGRLDRARSESEWIRRQLSQAVGLGNRKRGAFSNAERARIAVRNNIANLINRLDSANGRIGQHFRVSLKTGTYCSYAPEREIEWRVEWGVSGNELH